MQSFVNDLLDLSQMTNGHFALNNIEFDPNRVLEMVHTLFRPQAIAQGIDI